jgi:hypothetical protein
VADNETGQNANTAVVEKSGISKEVEDAVTPEMVEAGKLAIDKSANSETHSLENSIGAVYVAMAAKDQDALREKGDTAQLKHSKRINGWLYFGVITMSILAIALITMMVVALVS